MAQKERSVKGRILGILGIVLIAAALTLTLWNFAASKNAASDAAVIAEELCALMPEKSVGISDGRENTAMPQAELGGENFVGVIEVPIYNKKLPIYNKWDAKTVAKFPCRFTGSVYDGTLIVGGSDAIGHFDFMENITVGDVVRITDMTGGVFEYTVAEIEISESADADTLASEHALTIFARDTYTLKYVIVRCEK